MNSGQKYTDNRTSCVLVITYVKIYYINYINYINHINHINYINHINHTDWDAVDDGDTDDDGVDDDNCWLSDDDDFDF